MFPLALFVCAGNTCRSPMAEAAFRAMTPSHKPWRCASAGLAATSGASISSNAKAALAEIKCAPSYLTHRSQPVTANLVQEASVIVVMTNGHAQKMLDRFPNAADKLYLMRDFDPASPKGSDLNDPFCGSFETYCACRDLICAAMPGLIHFLTGTHPIPITHHSP